jgi:hypothetical protein
MPTVAERVQMHLEDRTYDLYICPHAWALSRKLLNVETGERRPLRCGLWTCRYCGPRKVNEWRQFIAAAEPTLHLVLTKAGKTVEEAARALTTFMQALRRGSKRKGRPSYPVEYFAVLERHANFEENGFHWHILLKGVESIPYATIKELWASATHGMAENGWIQRITNSKAIGYVTKYLTKDIFREERGTKLVERRVKGLAFDEAAGCHVVTEEVIQEEASSQARRIRYSRKFFPKSIEELRADLFTPQEQQEAMEQEASAGEMSVEAAQAGGQEQATEWKKQCSPWRIQEITPQISSVKEYETLLRHGLTEVIAERVASGRRLSRRVLTVWNYQRELSSRSVDEVPKRVEALRRVG